jgi:hypothetical protein
MTTANTPLGSPAAALDSIAPARKLDTFLGRIDLIAVISALLGACLLGVTAIVVAAVELSRLIAMLWADPIDRWLVVAFAAALIWVVVRGKKLCVS